MVVFDTGLTPQLAQRRAAVETQVDELDDVLAHAPRRALAQERERPEPLLEIHARAKKQRRVVVEEPLQDSHGRRRFRPRLGMADRDLAAVRDG
jgi:hypothetical protein